MPNILKAPAKVQAAKTFLSSFHDAANDRLYMGLGDAGAEWGTPATPDTPIDSYDEEQDFWQNLIGIGLVSGANDTELVAPRKTWVSGTTYVVFDESDDDGSGTYDIALGRDFYICNTESAPKVYKCITAGGGTSTNEPTHTDPTGVTEADGFEWAYLYTIGAGADVPATLLTTSWMPVPTTAQAYSNGLATTIGDMALGDGSGNYKSGVVYQVHATTGDTNAADMDSDSNNTWVEFEGEYDVGAFYVGCSISFPDFAGTGNEIGNVAYRQVALVRNPRDNTGAFISDQWRGAAGTGNFESHTTLSRSVVLTLDNRVTITRSTGQTETLRAILEF